MDLLRRVQEATGEGITGTMLDELTAGSSQFHAGSSNGSMMTTHRLSKSPGVKAGASISKSVTLQHSKPFLVRLLEDHGGLRNVRPRRLARTAGRGALSDRRFRFHQRCVPLNTCCSWRPHSCCSSRRREVGTAPVLLGEIAALWYILDLCGSTRTREKRGRTSSSTGSHSSWRSRPSTTRDVAPYQCAPGQPARAATL